MCRCIGLVTFRVSRRRCEMYCGHARLYGCLSVCLSAATCPHYCTAPDVTWESGRGCPLVVQYWRIRGFAIMRYINLLLTLTLGGFSIGARVVLLWQHCGNTWQSPAVIRQDCTHAANAHYAFQRRLPSTASLTGDKIDGHAACAVPFRPYCGVL